MDDKTWILVLFVGSGVLLILLAVPMILKRIKPNYLYGFRVTKTLSDPEIWYQANTYAGWRLQWSGIVIIISSIGLYLVPVLTLDGYAWSILGVFGIVITIAVVQSFVYLRKL